MKHFLDLGAHKLEGLKEFTKKLNINKEWNVYSYEPNIAIHKESEKIIETIKNNYAYFEFNKKAVMDESGTITFNGHRGAWKDQTKSDFMEGYTTGSNALDTNPLIGDTMTIGTKVFTFVPLGTANADGEIDVEALLADTQANVIAAIRGTDHNDPHPLVTCDQAFLGDVLAITALVGGTAGNNIATTETFTANSNVFSAVKLANGGDCSKADAVTALVAAITASDTQGVGAVDGAGDTVELTADVAGVAGNAIAISTTMINATFAGGAIALSGGIDGTVGVAGESCMDASWLYLAVADNTIADKNWRRVTLGTAY
jgi:hypothetical protein